MEACAKCEKLRPCFPCAREKQTKTLLHKMPAQTSLTSRLSEMSSTSVCSCLSKTAVPPLLICTCCKFHPKACITMGDANGEDFHCMSVGG